MSDTKRNHYLSQCISKNFIINDTQTFWTYDCKQRNGLQEKKIKKLFSSLRIWNQEFENTLGRNVENLVSKDLKYLAEKQMLKTIIPSNEGLRVPQFYCEAINDEEMEKRLSKLIFQTMLVQRNNKKNPDVGVESTIAKFYEADVGIKMPLTLVEINSIGLYPPLILIDCMCFSFFVPKTDRINNTCGHVCFSFPISPRRMLVWGNVEDVSFFCKKYANIHYFNLCRIEQQKKQCIIASQDKPYLELISKHIDGFSSGDRQVRVESVRE